MLASLHLEQNKPSMLFCKRFTKISLWAGANLLVFEFHRNQLRAQLNQLPVAKNKVEVVVPDEMMVEEEDIEDIEEDAADAEVRKQEAAKKAKEMEIKKMSQVHWSRACICPFILH